MRGADAWAPAAKEPSDPVPGDRARDAGGRPRRAVALLAGLSLMIVLYSPRALPAASHAPTAPDERLERIVVRARGFVYAVGLMGVTGERAALADSATVIASRLKAITDVPVLVGVGISSPEQAVEVCEVADGVVVGTALVRRVLETRSPEAAGELIGSFRDALDRG